MPDNGIGLNFDAVKGFLAPESPLNKNLKSLQFNPDGTLKVDLFDDFLGGGTSPATANATSAVSSVGEVAGKQPGRFSLANPGFQDALGQIAQALDPEGLGGRLGGIASNRASNEIFSQLLNQMLGLGGDQGNPSQAVGASLPPGAIGSLSPEQLSQAFQLSEQSQAQDFSQATELAELSRAITNDQFNNSLNVAQKENLESITENRRSPEELSDLRIKEIEAGKVPRTSVQSLNLDPDGNKTPTKEKHRWLIDSITGKRITHLGLDLQAEANSGGGGDPLTKSRLWLSFIDRAAKDKLSREGFGEFIKLADGTKTYRYTEPEKAQVAYREFIESKLSQAIEAGLVTEEIGKVLLDEPVPLATNAEPDIEQTIEAIEEPGIAQKALEFFGRPSDEQKQRLIDILNKDKQNEDIQELPTGSAGAEAAKKLSVGDRFKVNGKVFEKTGPNDFDERK